MESQSRERGELKRGKNSEEAFIFVAFSCQSTFLMLSSQWFDQVKQPRWRSQITEMIALKGLSDRQIYHYLIAEIPFSLRQKVLCIYNLLTVSEL